MQMHGKHHVEVVVNRVGYTEYQDERKKLLCVTGHEITITRVHTVHR